jgi:hypothetical protein
LRSSRFPRPGNTGSIANMLSNIAYSEVAAVIPLLLKPGISPAPLRSPDEC